MMYENVFETWCVLKQICRMPQRSGECWSRWCGASNLFMLDTHNVCKYIPFHRMDMENYHWTLHAIECAAWRTSDSYAAVVFIVNSRQLRTRCEIIYCDESIILSDISVFVCGELAVVGSMLVLWQRHRRAPSFVFLSCNGTHSNKIFPRSIWRLM